MSNIHRTSRTSRSGAIGNSVVLYETLKKVQDQLRLISFSPEGNNENIAIISRMVADALSFPPRNCDKYPDFNDAITMLAKKRGWAGTKWNSERYCILANWLLATEEKGCKNGK